MQIADIQQDVLELRARIIFRFQKPHPHVVGVAVDNEQVEA
jgi:ABC-type phosphate transport system ATPase subunit